MKFMDVAHHYIGCKIVHTGLADIVTLEGTHLPYVTALATKCKPILFPLSAMIDEQKAERDRLGIKAFDKTSFSSISGLSKATFNRQVAEVTYLLSHHFDLFNLIEQGEAIDATTLTLNPYNP